MDDNVVRIRGLPWTATHDDVIKFFCDSQIAGGERGVHFTFSHEGRASGQAFVEFVSEDDVEKALEKNRGSIGSRYIEVFRSKRSEMDWVVKRAGADPNSKMSDACVKLRGLPFGCSKEEIAQFFSGLEIVPNGIMLPEDRLGRGTGEAFVQFTSQDIAERALGKHKERIGHRYIEIFKSCLGEAQAVTGRDRGFRSMGRPGPYDRGDRFGGGPVGRGGRNLKGCYDEEFDNYNSGGFGFGGRGRGGMRGRFADDFRGAGPGGQQYTSKTGHAVHMRGLPFQASDQDIFDFFSPLQPVRVSFEFSNTGRPTGEANVDFATHQEVMEAMKKHKSNMQHRYIELFLNSAERSMGGSSMGGYSGGSNMDSGFGGGNMGGGGYNSSGDGFGMDNSMGGNFSSGSGSYGGQAGQYANGQQYSSNNMGGNYRMGGTGTSQGEGYGGQGQGMNNYMSGGGGYNAGGMNSNYTAF